MNNEYFGKRYWPIDFRSLAHSAGQEVNQGLTKFKHVVVELINFSVPLNHCRCSFCNIILKVIPIDQNSV
jgi:hypothetical protein